MVLNMINEISPEMKQLAEAGDIKGGGKSKYPWLTLSPGQCFTVPEDKVKYGTLLTLAKRASEKYKRTFKVLHHKEHKIYEIGRIDGIVK